MIPRSQSQPKLIPPHMTLTHSALVDTSSVVGASYQSSMGNSPQRIGFHHPSQPLHFQNPIPHRRQLTPDIFLNAPGKQPVPPFQYNQQPQYMNINVSKSPVKPKKVYDVILRKGQDFYNFDDDVNSIFKVFSLPSWVSNRYDLTIESFKLSPQGIPCYHTHLKVTPKFNQPKTQMFFFEVEKDVLNRKVVYYIQSTLEPFKRINCVVIEGKTDLINEFLVIKIHDYDDFFVTTFERPYEELFEFAFSGHRINELSYPYIEPYDITNIQEKQEHYFLIFRGGAARSGAYIGAYQAILDMYPKFHKQVKGVVTASVGSLFGLMAIFKEPTEYINQVLTELSFIGQRDRVVKTEAQVLNKQVHYEEIQLKIKEVLFDYGIMQTELFDLLYSTVWSNPLLIQKFLAAIVGRNETLQQAMTMDVDNVQYMTAIHTDVSSQTHLVIPTVTKAPMLSNFYGILDGYLLKGEYIVELAMQIVTRFLIKKLAQNQYALAQILGVNLREINEVTLKGMSKRLTMKQLFLLTGEVQFTVLSVDTDSHIMRFLNHKTSPDLPVVHSIQIAFAMPFLVKLPKWKRSWGKYYVHFRNRRKQIDLTGHVFMDGSIIDSSPLIFLQNERLRQIFFSKRPNSKSKIMCFGTYPTEQMPAQFTRQNLFQDFFEVLKATTPIRQIMEITKCPPPPTFYPFEALSKPTDIPVIGIFTRIEQTLKNVSDNIIKETFSVRSHLFPQNCTFAEYIVTGKTPYEIDQRYRSYHALRDSVHELRDSVFSLNLNRVAVLKVLAQIIEKLDLPEYQQDSKYILRIKSNILQEVSSHAMYAQEQKKRKLFAQKKGGVAVEEFDSYIDQLETMLIDVLDDVRLIYRFGYFFRERFLMHDAKTLQNTLRKIVDIYTIDEKAPAHIKPHLKLYLENIFMVRKLEEYNDLNSLALYLDKFLLNMQNGNFNTYNPKLYKLNEIFKNFRLESMPEFLQFCLRLQQLQQPLIIQDRAFERQRQHSRFYIDGTLKRRTSNNLHIVLQSQGFHSKYLVKAYQQVNEAITFDHHQALDELFEELARMIIHQNQHIQIRSNPNGFCQGFAIEDLVKFIIVRADLNQELRKIMGNLEKKPIPKVIDLEYVKYQINEDLNLRLQKVYYNHLKNKCAVKAITTTGFSSFFSFLIAAGVDADTIEEELWSFRQNFDFDETKVFQEYSKMDWCLKQQMLIRDMQQLLWKSRYDVWGNMEKSARQHRIKVDIQRIREEFEESRQPIMKSFTDVMSHIISTARQSNFERNPQQYFAQSNSLRVYENYYQINRQMSLETKAIISMLMSMFQEQIRVIIMNLALQKVQQIIEFQGDPIKKEAMWRGVVILSFLKSDKYKRHIQKTLKKINLPSEIKMREFYDVTPTKIDITVNAIDFTDGKYVFINRYTYPEMPIWAALVIGASYPLIFAEVHSRESWLYHISLQNTQRARRLFFNETPQCERRAPLFGSGSLVDAFPLSLLTNQKVLESSFNKNSYTFLNFGLRTIPLRNHQMLGFYCRRFLDMHELRTLFSGPNKVVFVSQLSKLFMKHSNMLNSYVTSHDKLMQELYSPQVIRLPSRVNFLEYFRLTPYDECNQDTQQQAYFSTRQKFSPSVRTCFWQVKYNEYSIKLFFISKDKFRYDIFTDYNIYFKFRPEDKYQQIPNDYFIDFNLTQFQILFIKFGFIVDESLVIRTKEFIIDFTTLRNFIKLEAIYQLNYTQVTNQLVSPCRVKAKILKIPSTNIYGDQLIVRSNIDVKKHGLFCQVCCTALGLNKLMFIDQCRRQKCLSCQKVKPTKYICKTPKCHGAYCLNCLKDQLFIKHTVVTTCNEGHQLVFKGTKSNKEPKLFIRCECCFVPHSFYYEDVACGIKICTSCFSDINVDPQSPSQ